MCVGSIAVITVLYQNGGCHVISNEERVSQYPTICDIVCLLRTSFRDEVNLRPTVGVDPLLVSGMLHVCTCSLVFTTIPLYQSATTFPQHLVITSKL